MCVCVCTVCYIHWNQLFKAIQIRTPKVFALVCAYICKLTICHIHTYMSTSYKLYLWLRIVYEYFYLYWKLIRAVSVRLCRHLSSSHLPYLILSMLKNRWISSSWMRKLHTIAKACLLIPKNPFSVNWCMCRQKSRSFPQPRKKQEHKKKKPNMYRVRNRLAGECFSYHQEVEEAVKNVIYLFALTALQSIARCEQDRDEA